MGIASGLALPSISGMIKRSQSTAAVNWIVGAVNFTRHSAVHRRVTTTLCPLPVQGRCNRDWQNQLTVFTDRNKNAQLDPGDAIITKIPPLQGAGTIRWRSFRNRQYLQMTPKGYTNFQNGNFVYCANDKTPDLARQIIVNVQGRVRVVHARNVDGVPVDRHGKQLRC